MQSKFTKEYVINIDDKIPQIIEYFVEFYGESFREEITQKLNNTRFVFVGDDQDLLNFIEYKNQGCENLEQILYFVQEQNEQNEARRLLDLKNAKQINIYGHNSQVESLHDKLELINLRAYLDKNFFDNYKYMYLSIDEGKYKYRVEAVKIVTAADPEHMKVIFFSDADFVNHTRKLYQNTTYIREDTKVSKDDKLLILQICNYNPQNSYLIIIGKQV